MQTQGTFSHPNAEVRHSYPLAIREANLSTAFDLMRKTLPYALVRFGILVALSLATLVWVVTLFGGYYWLATTPVSLLAYVWFIGMCAGFGWLYMVVGRYFLYLLKAGHIAVLTELITTGGVARGDKSMFAYGKDVVAERFMQVNVLFGLDALIDGVVTAFNRTLDWIADLVPIPGLDSISSAVGALARATTTYIDETIFSYNLARGDENVWRSSKDGLVYYAQNAQEVLKTGLWIVVLDKVLGVVAWLLCLAPGFALAWVLPQSVSLMGLLPLGIAVLFALNVRSAFLKPLFLTLIMVKYHHSVQNQPIHTEWAAKLESVSDKFRALEDKARDFGKAESLKPAPAAATHSA